MGGLTSRSCVRKMVGEIDDDEPVAEVAEKKEDSGEETQKKESKKSLSDELLEVMEESESLNDYVDHVCAAASGPGGRMSLVSAMTHACVQSILRTEIKVVTSEVARYRTLLARKIQESPREELDFEATFKIEKLMESFGEGWRLLKQGEEEDAVFEAFMTKMNIRLPGSPEEPEKPSENDSASLVSIMIQCCMQSILRNEIKELALEMVEYRNVLSEKMLATPDEELDLQGTFNLCRLEESFGAGWHSFKHGCGADAAFDAFMTKMYIRLKDTTQSNTE